MKPLNPIMAALVIASVGASPLRTLASGGNTPAPAAANEDRNPVNALGRIIAANSDARRDAGKRFEDFLLQPNANGEKFVSDDANTALLGAVAREWGATLGNPGSVAMLYFVVGPGGPTPGWAASDPVLSKTFLSGLKWEGKLRSALSEWTGINKIDKTKDKGQVTAFLNDAAAKAATVFADPRTRAEIELSIAGNDTTDPVVPDPRRSTAGRFHALNREYTAKDLYVDGAEVREVKGPQDAKPRLISMKIYTKRMPDGSLQNEIGIFDISDEYNIYGQRFPVGGPNPPPFALDDRTPGHRKYELKFETLPNGDRKIVFARPGGGAPLETTVSKLYTERANQAATMERNIVTVGGKDFYTVPQGGGRGGFALFPKELIDGRSARGSDPRELIPSLYSEVVKRGSDGRPENLPGKRHLGSVGSAAYHLQYAEVVDENGRKRGHWEVKDGPGDPDPVPTAGDPAAPGGAAPGGAAPGGTPSQPRPEGGLSIPDLLSTFFALPISQGKCKIHPEDEADIAPNLKGKYALLRCKYNERDGMKQVLLVPKSAVHPDQTLEFGNTSDLLLLRARLFDHYIILEFDKQVQFLDLLAYDQDASGKDKNFAMSGFVQNGNAHKFVSMVPFVEALKKYLKNVPPAALTEVPKRVAQAQGSKPYYADATFPEDKFLVMVTAGGKPYMVWPDFKPEGAPADPAAGQYTGLTGGPANAFDGSVSSVNAPFEEGFDTADKWRATLIGTKDEAENRGVALYEVTDPIGKSPLKKYMVGFKFKALDPKDPAQPDGEKVEAMFRQRPFEVFNAASPHPGSGLKMQSLAGSAVVVKRVAAGYKFVSGSKKDKGVMAMFQNKQVSASNAQSGPANCVGPVLWWGLSDADALKACKEDKL